MHGLMMDSPLLITEIMRFADRNYADREIVSVTFDNPRHRTTWSEVFRRARRLANALKAAGVKPGDRIATIAWNDYRHLELYYAVSCMGAVVHTLNPRLFADQLIYIVNHAEDKWIFVDLTFVPLFEKLQDKMESASEQLKQMQNELQQNNLLSKETLEKYMELQELFKELTSDEMKKAMEQLRNKLNEMNRQQAQQDMQNMKIDEEMFQ